MTFFLRGLGLALILLLVPTSGVLAQEEDDFEDLENLFEEEDGGQEAGAEDFAGDDEGFDAAEFEDPSDAGTGVADGPDADFEYIDDLLAGDEDVLDNTGYSYDDRNRRDPFRSLLIRNDAGQREKTGERPEGIAGLAVNEITVTGVWVTEDGPVAQVQAANKAKSYLIRPGDQLWDGEVLRITYERYAGSEIVFNQEVTDPQAPKPFREVIRRLEP